MNIFDIGSNNDNDDGLTDVPPSSGSDDAKNTPSNKSFIKPVNIFDITPDVPKPNISPVAPLVNSGSENTLESKLALESELVSSTDDVNTVSINTNKFVDDVEYVPVDSTVVEPVVQESSIPISNVQTTPINSNKKKSRIKRLSDKISNVNVRQYFSRDKYSGLVNAGKASLGFAAYYGGKALSGTVKGISNGASNTYNYLAPKVRDIDFSGVKNVFTTKYVRFAVVAGIMTLNTGDTTRQISHANASNNSKSKNTTTIDNFSKSTSANSKPADKTFNYSDYSGKSNNFDWKKILVIPGLDDSHIETKYDHIVVPYAIGNVPSTGAERLVNVTSGQDLWNIVSENYNLTNNSDIAKKVNEVSRYNIEHNINQPKILLDTKAVIDGKVVSQADGIMGDVLATGKILLPGLVNGNDSSKTDKSKNNNNTNTNNARSSNLVSNNNYADPSNSSWVARMNTKSMRSIVHFDNLENATQKVYTAADSARIDSLWRNFDPKLLSDSILNAKKDSVLSAKKMEKIFEKWDDTPRTFTPLIINSDTLHSTSTGLLMLKELCSQNPKGPSCNISGQMNSVIVNSNSTIYTNTPIGPNYKLTDSISLADKLKKAYYADNDSTTAMDRLRNAYSGPDTTTNVVNNGTINSTFVSKYPNIFKNIPAGPTCSDSIDSIVAPKQQYFNTDTIKSNTKDSLHTMWNNTFNANSYYSYNSLASNANKSELVAYVLDKYLSGTVANATKELGISKYKLYQLLDKESSEVKKTLALDSTFDRFRKSKLSTKDIDSYLRTRYI